MEILKDASATAIYGSMGANGVVLITTKQGTSDTPRIEFCDDGGHLHAAQAHRRARP